MILFFKKYIFVVAAIILSAGFVTFVYAAYPAFNQPADNLHAEVRYGTSEQIYYPPNSGNPECKIVNNNSNAGKTVLVPLKSPLEWGFFKFSAGEIGTNEGTYLANNGVTLSNCPGCVDICPNIGGEQCSLPSNKVKDQNGNCVDLPPPQECPSGQAYNPQTRACQGAVVGCDAYDAGGYHVLQICFSNNFCPTWTLQDRRGLEDLYCP